MSHTIMLVITSPTNMQVFYILNLLWRPSVKGCFNITWMYQSCTCALGSPSKNWKEMAKAILLHRQNFCMRIQAMLRKLRYKSRQSCVYRSYRFCVKQNLRHEEQWEEGHTIWASVPVNAKEMSGGGRMRGRKRLPSVLQNALCCFSTKRKGISKELRDLVSRISFATGHLKRISYSPQHCNYKRVDNSSLTQRLWSQKDFHQQNVGTLWTWVQVLQSASQNSSRDLQL